MPEVSSTVVRSMGEAAAASAALLQRCVDHAVTELQQAGGQATSSTQRQDLDAAWRALQSQRVVWSVRFPQLLGRAFRQAAEAAEARPVATERDEPDIDALTLVDEGEIAQEIEASRLAQQLVAGLERPLADLDALMSSALGLEAIRPERNPLRPEVYARVLRGLMAEANAEPAWTALWLRHMAQPLAQGLEQVYRDQAHLLTLARVQAAGYRVVGTASRPGALMPAAGPAGPGAPLPAGAASPGGSGAQASGATANGSANAGSAAVASGRADAPAQPVPLREFLLRGAAHAQQPPSASYYAAVDAELRAMEAAADDAAYDARAARQYEHVPPVDRPPRRVATDAALPQEIWGDYGPARTRALVRTRLKSQVREVGQAYGLELVRALVDQVAQDPRLLAPVREAIVGLEPSLLRLAMVAPRFFSDDAHPGRRLVEGVAERSFRYNDEFSVEFQGFFHPVGQGFQRLNRIERFEDAEPFRQLLATLQAGWAAQDALDEEGERQVLASVQFAERRQAEAERIAADLRLREDLQDVPQAVQDFVLGPWALVVAQARLAEPQGGIDPGGYLAVVSDLLWSVKRDLTLHEPARAFELIPRVLLKLRGGLAMLGQDPAESDTVFRALEALHRPVLKLRARHRHRDLVPPAPPPAPAAAPAREPGALWLGQQEMRTVGFAETEPSHFAALGETARADGDGPDAGEPAQVVARLAVGALVDLHARQQWRRARLVWASEKGSFFMFVSHGGQPHSMTRRSLERLVRERLLRPVDAQAVVPRALASLAEPSVPALLAA